MYSVTWHTEQRVVLVEIQGDIQLHEVVALNQQVADKIEHGIAPVHIVTEITSVGKLPTNIREMTVATSYIRHPNLGWIILINPPKLANFVASLVGGVMRLKFRSVTMLEEAITTLQQVDFTLPRA